MQEIRPAHHLFEDHYVVGPPPVDRQQAIDAARIDAADDRSWFLTHPFADERHRPASIREQKAFSLKPDDRVLVRRLSDGTQLRIPYTPTKDSQ